MTDHTGHHELHQRTAREWSGLAGETLAVENIGGCVYAFGSELAVRRLRDRFGRRGHVAFSPPRQSWYFVLDPDADHPRGVHAMIETSRAALSERTPVFRVDMGDFAAGADPVEAGRVCDELRDAFERITGADCRVTLRDQRELVLGTSNDGKTTTARRPSM